MPNELPILVDICGHAAACGILRRLGLLRHTCALKLALVLRQCSQSLRLRLCLRSLFSLTLCGVLSLLLRERLWRLLRSCSLLRGCLVRFYKYAEGLISETETYREGA